MRTVLAPTLKNEAIVQSVVDEIKKCVHCGFCNSVCPTYRLTGNELQGPRGRIYLVKGLLEQDDSNETLEDSLSKCLTCRACEPACPSGVQYGKIAEEARLLIHNRTGNRSIFQKLLLKIVPDPAKFRKFYQIGRKLRLLLWSDALREALSRKLPLPSKLETTTHSKVVLLQGCVQRVLTPAVVEHLANLLNTRNIRFRVLPEEQCCGSLHLHLGDEDAFTKLISKNIAQAHLEPDDVVVSTASGCGVTLTDYDQYGSQTDSANRFSQAVMDVSEYLKGFEFKKASTATRVVFQSPCTLQHGQRVRGVVEEILTRTGYDVLPIRESDQCCGSAGTYSLLQPKPARELRAKKVNTITEANPEIVVTANVGCQLFLEPALKVPVLHWIQLLS